jgi:hypothetical protein
MIRFVCHWLGIDNGSGRLYLFYSGFGANFGELMIFGSIVGVYRNHKCASCWRPGRHALDDTGQKVCHKHYTHDGVARVRAKHKRKFPLHIAHDPSWKE